MGGNWFFIINDSPIDVKPDNIRALTEAGIAIRETLYANHLEGENGGIIDHIIFYGPALTTHGHSRNFVLCPDNAYDRSPCGTGSSARLACLAADDKLAPNTDIIQESIIGSSYTLSYQLSEQQNKASVSVVPKLCGQAFVTKEAMMVDNPDDPLRLGVNV
jgi:Proline racemase